MEEKQFIDVDGKPIIHMASYILRCSISRKMEIGDRVQVMEMRQSDHPFTYCYGHRGGSGYIRMDQLQLAP